jgi:hypothetical protein
MILFLLFDFSLFESEPNDCIQPYTHDSWIKNVLLCGRAVCYVSGAKSNFRGCEINPLNPTGHVMHQQFNIQQLYVLPTLYLCVLYLSENKQRLVPLTA